ncbi:hypothetical protein GS921_00360 [Rhodococcus hoagii]|nr:hypothetical protein [Prescottella equi]
MAKTVHHLTVSIDTDEVRHWAEKRADAHHPGIATLLYDAAERLEAGTHPLLAEGGDQP